MKNLSSWLVVIFMLMFWLFRVIVAVADSMGSVFVTKPLDATTEIVLLFVVLACVPFIFKRKLFGALVYLGGYGYYFGRFLFENVMKLINNETISLTVYTDMFFALIGIAIPLFAIFDILLDRNRMKNPIDKKTDWFYKNEQYDRELDERADKNNYRTL